MSTRAQVVKRKGTMADTGGPVAKWAKHKQRITRSGPGASLIAALNISHDEEREKWRAAVAKAVKQRDAVKLKAKDEHASEIKSLTEQYVDCATKLRDEDAAKIRELTEQVSNERINNRQMFASAADMGVENRELSAFNRELSTTNTQLTEDLDAELVTNDELFASSADVGIKNDELSAEMARLTSELATEQAATRSLKAANYCLTVNNGELTAEVALLQGTTDSLAEMYEDIEEKRCGDITILRQHNSDLCEDLEQWDEQLVEVTRQRDVGVERERAASLTFKQTVANQRGEIVAAKVHAETVKERVLADRALDVETIVALRARVEALEWGAENTRVISSEFQKNGQPPSF
jgi:hypothetical protein